MLQFSLLNGALHDSLCEGMLTDSVLDLDQVRQCEVLTANKQVSFVIPSMYSKLSLSGHLMQAPSRCKDSAIGDQSLHFNCSSPSEQGQFDVRTNSLVIKAVVTKRVYCTEYQGLC